MYTFLTILVSEYVSSFRFPYILLMHVRYCQFVQDTDFTDQYINLENAEKNPPDDTLDDIMEYETINEKEDGKEVLVAGLVVPTSNHVNKEDKSVLKQAFQVHSDIRLLFKTL